MRKLTDSDKTEILKLYRETAETTSTLAERYGVSNSTISRLLKGILPEEDYEYLVSLKRAARTPEGRALVSYEQLPLLGQSQEDEIAATQTPVEELE
ncbi:helix-turn-helix domain-containing protein, partial [Cylindrospermopsis raciborskii CS-506_B]|nr:helix-turn-helix domain-containing protein [Cylindrospermopsis raciborskii CS-506_B]